MLMSDSQPSLTEDELEKAIKSLKDKVDEMKNDLKGEIEVCYLGTFVENTRALEILVVEYQL